MTAKFKMTVNHILKLAICIIIMPIVTWGVIGITVPITRTHSGVRSYVLRKIPIGTDMSEVIETAESKGWEIETIYDSGLSVDIVTEKVYEYGIDPPGSKIAGERCMLIYLGEYNNPFFVDVFCYVAFDENEKVVEACARKDIDGI